MKTARDGYCTTGSTGVESGEGLGKAIPTNNLGVSLRFKQKYKLLNSLHNLRVVYVDDDVDNTHHHFSMI